VAVGHLDPIVGRGIASILESDQSVHLLTDNLERPILQHTSRRTPRAVIVDETVEHSLLEQLKSRRPAPGVVVLASEPTDLLGRLLFDIGVTCLARGASSADLLTAIHLAARGKPTFSGSDPRLPQRLVSTGGLTDRESQVLTLLSQGKTYAEIAAHLHIAYETARTHSRSICKKLGVASRLDLIRTAPSGLDPQVPHS